MRLRMEQDEDSESTVEVGDGADSRAIPPFLRAAMHHRVMTADEERAAVLEVRRLEREHWEALLAVSDVAAEAALWVKLHAAERELDLAGVQRVADLARVVPIDILALASALARVDRDRACVAYLRALVELGGVGTEQRERVRQTYRAQEEAKHRFLRANLRLVGLLVWRYADPDGHVKLMDAYQEGALGLAHALDLFEVERGHRFSTYASWWVRSRVANAALDAGRTVRVPRWVQDVLRQVHRAQREVAASGGDPSDEAVVAECARLPVDKVRRAIDAEADAREPLDLDERMGDGDEDDVAVAETVVDPDARPPDDRIDAACAIALLARRSRRDAKVLRLHYLEDLTFDEVGERLGVTGERVRQIEVLAIRKLRKVLRVKVRSWSVAKRKHGELIAKLRECAAAQMTCEQAAAHCGVTYARAYNLAYKAGIAFCKAAKPALVDAPDAASCSALVRRALRERGVVEVCDVDAPHGKVVIACALRDEVAAGRAVRLFRGVYATPAAAAAVREAVSRASAVGGGGAL